MKPMIMEQNYLMNLKINLETKKTDWLSQFFLVYKQLNLFIYEIALLF